MMNLHLEKGFITHARPECVQWLYEKSPDVTRQKIAAIIKAAKTAVDDNDPFMLSYMIDPVIRLCYEDLKWIQCLGQQFYERLAPIVGKLNMDSSS